MRLQKIKRRNNSSLVLELTPLIDVVFLLLIFFMVATTFEDVNSGIKVELPQSSIKELTDVDSVQVIIEKDQKVTIFSKVGGESVGTVSSSLETLKDDLFPILGSAKEKNVVISADRGLDYGIIVGVMTGAKEAGATSLDIDTTDTN